MSNYQLDLSPEAFRARISDMVSERDTLRAQVAALKAENERLREQAVSAMERYARLVDAGERRAQEVRAVAAERDALRLDLARVTADAARRCSALEANRTEQVQLTNDTIDALMARIADLRAKLDALRAAASDVLYSLPQGEFVAVYEALRAALAASEEG